MEYKESKIDIAIEHLEKINSQWISGKIGKRTHDEQRLIILLEFANAVIRDFHIGE